MFEPLNVQSVLLDAALLAAAVGAIAAWRTGRRSRTAILGLGLAATYAVGLATTFVSLRGGTAIAAIATAVPCVLLHRRFLAGGRPLVPDGLAALAVLCLFGYFALCVL